MAGEDLDDTAEPKDLGAALLERVARPERGDEGYGLPGLFARAGEVVALVGGITGAGGADPARERAVTAAVRRAAADGLLSSARGCARGLADALGRCCVDLGAALRVPFPAPKEEVLFAEGGGGVVVSLPHDRLGRLQAVAALAGAPLVVLGATGGDTLRIQSALSVPVAELSRAWRAGNPPA